MTCRLTLTLPPAFGNRIVSVESNRFSIGRTPENDLSIADNSLSRRHALIEEVDGRYDLYDLDSSNGTFINDRQVTGPTELFDWDVLTFGAIGDILVRLEEDVSPATATGDISVESPVVAAFQPTTPASNQFFLSTPVVAIAAALLIIVVSGVALLIINSSPDTTTSRIEKRQQNGNTENDNAAPSPTDSVSNDSPSPDQNRNVNDSTDVLPIEAYASRVLSGISRDAHPVLPEKSLSEINLEVQRYQGKASLGEEIREMRRVLPQVSAIAKANGLRVPMAVYATLASIDQNGGGAPAQVAASLCPNLARLRGVFGDELANDSLLTIAALEEGPSLQGRITRLAGRVNDSPTTIRSIWYLHDHQVISEQTHRFVLRFMAIGVISQDPRKFGIPADPIVF